MKSNIQFFDQISLKDKKSVGGKNSSLGEMFQNLSQFGIQVPYGFAIKVDGYIEFMKHNKLQKKIENLMKQIINKQDDIVHISKIGNKIRQLIVNGAFPDSLQHQILKSYESLCQYYNTDQVDVAVRSSSIGEDSVSNSYAGQQDTYLNIRGPHLLLLRIKDCYASLYTDRAICYRLDKNEPEENIQMSVGVQKMVRSDLGTSGVIFTVDTESGFKDAIIINASYGLGELIVGGSIEPDEYIIFKKKRCIIDKKIGRKNEKLVYCENNQTRGDRDPSASDLPQSPQDGLNITIKGGAMGESPNQTKKIDVPLNDQNRFCLSDSEILKLSDWALLIENHYSKLSNVYQPMDIEWAIDGLNGDLFIVQARPETVISQKNQAIINQYEICRDQTKNVIVSGIAVGEKISSGCVKFIDSLGTIADIQSFNKGDILVVESTSPDWEPIMKLAGAIVTNRGGRTCHAAIIAREQGIPAIVGTGNATQLLKSNDHVTVSCTEGEIGHVYQGNLQFESKSIDINSLSIPSNVNIMFNLASPDIAFKTSILPNKGVGLAREEFIINNFIKIHPLACLNYQTLDPELKKQIDQLTIGYPNAIDYYVNKLAYGISKIGAAFYPNDVILRFSDFKTNEYRNLLGGGIYEPIEENPMIGWRGASRYYSEQFEQAFGLECLAIKKVREEMGLTNVIVMIPFCRSPEECLKVYQTMEKYGLKRGLNGLRVYLMAEIPSNVILAEEFCQLVDGFSIGSNDLTQLVLGLDRDSHLVSHIYDERHPAVKKMIKKVIKVAKKNNVKIGICGQAPSDFPDFVEFLLDNQIDSISITPDSLINVLQTINKIENCQSLNH